MRIAKHCVLMLTLAAALAACETRVFEEGQVDGSTVDAGLTSDGPGQSPDVNNAGYNTDDDGDGYSEAQGDCDDTKKEVNPKAKEICTDGIDNNCNGSKDLFEADQDKDGFGPCNGDCDDTNKFIHPSATEVPDGVDNNCDGYIDDDYDGDGYPLAKGDCNDKDAKIHPKAKENCYDGVDNNCNTYIDKAEPDMDKDGYGPCTGDCDDTDPKVNPAAVELAGDGKDNNCDYLVDADIDGDGWTKDNGDCNDADAKIYPGATISCNSTGDANCNKIADNLEKQDKDNDGTSVCDGDCDDNNPSRSPDFVEIPGDGVDNDCDGKKDNVLKCDCTAGLNEAQAADLCLKNVTVSRGGSPSSRGVRQGSYGLIKPKQGCGFFTVSTGHAWSSAVQIGSKMGPGGNPVTTTGCMTCTIPSSSKWIHPGPNGCCESKMENDASWVKLTIKVPKNAKGFKFDFIFLSAEYPEWVHTQFNDTFYAVQTSQALTKVQNISFDIKGQPLTVNNGWFENPTSATQKLTGTGYDKYGSSSGWLTTTAPAKPGETMTLTFWVHDEGDQIYDSAVIIDNWRWIASKVSGPSTIK